MAKRRKSKKRAYEHKVYRWIVAVVAVVAVVGLVSMFWGNQITGLFSYNVEIAADGTPSIAIAEPSLAEGVISIDAPGPLLAPGVRIQSYFVASGSQPPVDPAGQTIGRGGHWVENPEAGEWWWVAY